MITGNHERKIKEYFLIDYVGEELGVVRPREGEEIIGIPYGRISDNSPPFIEHRKNGKTFIAVNALDVSKIIFDG